MRANSKNSRAQSVLIAILALTLTLGAEQANARELVQTDKPDKRPNILLIVADDLGYSDLGSYGGEFNTPVLDKLAENGVRFTDFYVSPACATTRSMLLTGTDNHVAGLGTFENFIPPDAQGKPGYEGWMNRRVVTVASSLRDGGYHTYLAGKWHLGYEPDHSPCTRV